MRPGYGNTLDVDVRQWIVEEKEDVAILLSCPECGALYEVGVQDLRDIQTDGQVTCECGCSINTMSALFGIDSV